MSTVEFLEGLGWRLCFMMLPGWSPPCGFRWLSSWSLSSCEFWLSLGECYLTLSSWLLTSVVSWSNIHTMAREDESPLPLGCGVLRASCAYHSEPGYYLQEEGSLLIWTSRVCSSIVTACLLLLNELLPSHPCRCPGVRPAGGSVGPRVVKGSSLVVCRTLIVCWAMLIDLKEKKEPFLSGAPLPRLAFLFYLICFGNFPGLGWSLEHIDLVTTWINILYHKMCPPPLFPFLLRHD